jgi:hypothetical protein
MLIGPLASEFATLIALLAGLIAVCGFLAHAGPVLAGAPEEKIREATVLGGIAGLALGAGVVVLSAIINGVIA